MTDVPFGFGPHREDDEPGRGPGGPDDLTGLGLPGFGLPGMPGAGGKRTGARQPKKGAKKSGKRTSGNPAKAAQQKAAQQAAAQERTANPFGDPAAEEMDYEKAAAALDLPKDFSKFLK